MYALPSSGGTVPKASASTRPVEDNPLIASGRISSQPIEDNPLIANGRFKPPRKFIHPRTIVEQPPIDFQYKDWLQDLTEMLSIKEPTLEHPDPQFEDKMRIFIDQLNLCLDVREEYIPSESFRERHRLFGLLQHQDPTKRGTMGKVAAEFLQQLHRIHSSGTISRYADPDHYIPSQHFQSRGSLQRILGFLRFPVFNPAPAPESEALKGLENMRIETEFLGDDVIQRSISDGKVLMERWRRVRGGGRLADGAAYIEQEISTQALRMVKKVRMNAPGRYYVDEIEIYMKLRDERNLFAIFSGWYWDGRYVCIVTEYFEHGSLVRFKEDYPLQAKSNAREITSQLLQAIKAVYDCGLCTGPINPKDVFVSSLLPVSIKLGRIRVTDSASVIHSDAQGIRSVGSILYWILASPTSFSSILWQMLRFDHKNGIEGTPSGALRACGASKGVIDLIQKLSATDPRYRLSVSQALGHPWITSDVHNKYKLSVNALSTSSVEYEGVVWRQLKEISYGITGSSSLFDGEGLGQLRVVKCVSFEVHQARQMEYDREAEVLHILSKNPESFAQFLGWYSDDRYIYFVMEYAEHSDLERFLRCDGGSGGDLEIMRKITQEAGAITHQVLIGLSYLQDNKISYRDFRPKNILLFSTFPMRVKLVLAEFEHIQADIHPYLAPELLDLLEPTMVSRPLSTTAANLWSLACLVHKILTSEDLFSAYDPTPGNQPRTPTLDLDKLKSYCTGEICLPLAPLERSPLRDSWTTFLKQLLDPNPSSRITLKEALDGDVIRVLQVTYPYRWEVVFRDREVIHRTHKGNIVLKETATLEGGNMGTVSVMEEFAAGKVVLGTKIAVKMITKNVYNNNKINYVRELLTLIDLKGNDDLFVQFLGWYEDKHALYLAMEFIEHGDLGQYIEKEGPEVKSQAKEIVTQLLEGLGFLHDRGICHRDLKPQNVLLASISPVRVKLADFGLSKSTRESELKTRVGTEGFKAPELLGLLPPKFRPHKNAEYTQAVDMWSLGCLLYKMLTLELPFIERELFSEISGVEQCVTDTYLDYSLLRQFCFNQIDFPHISLCKASTSDSGIDFVRRLLEPDPRSRMCVMDAFNHRWLREEDTVAVPGPQPNSYTIRRQFGILGIHISQRTADSLMAQLVGGHKEGVQYYLPAKVLEDLKELQISACGGGLALLVKVLLSICPATMGPGSVASRWTLNPDFTGSASDPVVSSNDGIPLLQAAVVSGNTETIQFLLDIGLDTNKTSPEPSSQTALQIAASIGNIDVVTMLLAHGAEVNAGPSEVGGRTALQAAAGAGYLDLVKLLLGRGADCNVKPSDEQGRTAIQAAAEAGHIEVILELLAHGALINAAPCKAKGCTALQAAAGAGYIETVSLLLSKGADVNSGPSEAGGRSALQAAAQNTSLEVAQLLLEHGADINAKPAISYGFTALQAAAVCGSKTMIELFLAQGANINAPPSGTGGRTALQAAAQFGAVDEVKVLLNHGADVNADPSDQFGRTALQAAAEGGFTDIVKVLSEHDAYLEACPASVSGRTAIQAAAECGQTKMVQLLLDLGVEVDSEPCPVGGRTALQAAAEQGHLEIVELLLDNDADPNAEECTEDGRTALRAAAENGHLEVVRLLLRYNADPKYGERSAESVALLNGHKMVAECIASWGERV